MMGTKSYGIDIHGLKCEKTTCDFEDERIQVKDFPKWINKPCPKCGTVLLTETEFKRVQNILATYMLTPPPKNSDSDKGYVHMIMDMADPKKASVTIESIQQ